MTNNIYPSGAIERPVHENKAQISIYGDRFHNDQSLYEYLIEFLLVFSSAKKADGSGKLMFHDDEPLNYYVEPRNGLRRFVFFEQAKKTKRIPADEQAYEDIKKILLKHIECDNEKQKQEFLFAVQDLFRGYAAVLKNRSWCAQALLPLCPEMIFCEEMPSDSKRINIGKQFNVAAGYSLDDTYFDSVDSFDMTRHNFLARGGEVYYLHLMQVLDNDHVSKEKLQALLKNLLTDKSSDFSNLANWIQNTWEKEKNLDPEKLIGKMNIGFIPIDSYKKSGKNAVDELICFLSNQLHPVKRIELMAKGLMLQIMRMLTDRTEEYLGYQQTPWIIDMCGKNSSIIKQLSANSFEKISELFSSAINKWIKNARNDDDNIDLKEEYVQYVKARKESFDIFKGKGKELQCIIPSKGPYERFSLSEDLVKFLVLSLVPPSGKIDLDLFLKKLYTHYSFVIGPEEYKMCINGQSLDIELTNSFNKNKEAFQKFLKDAGFLRDLSDATSIVVNPYKEVILE